MFKRVIPEFELKCPNFGSRSHARYQLGREAENAGYFCYLVDPVAHNVPVNRVDNFFIVERQPLDGEFHLRSLKLLLPTSTDCGKSMYSSVIA